MIGVAYRAKLMTVKILDRRGIGSTKAMAAGIRYAAANGARIINLSLETPTDDKRVRAAIKAAQAAGVLIVCSAGNEGTDLDRRPLFPVAIPAPNLVGVGATAPADGLALTKFSNYGSLTVPVAAPGEGVVSTARNGGYETRSGTSMAAPHVAGVAALMASVNPRLSAAELRALLLEHAVRPPEPGRPGSVDALGSVLAASARARRPARPAARRAHPRRHARRGPDPRPVRPRRRPHRRRGRARAARRPHGQRRALQRLPAHRDPAPRRGPPAHRRGARRGRPRAGRHAPPRSAAAPRPRPRSRSAAPARPETCSRSCCKAARPRTRISLVSGGTGMGIADAARGIVDGGLTSRAIFPSDPGGLVFTQFAQRDGCLVTSGVPTQLPAEGVASAAPAEFLADLGTRNPRVFATSAEAAAFVRATPGAWGYVEPADSEGLEVGLCRSYPLGIVTRGAPSGPLAGLLRRIAHEPAP